MMNGETRPAWLEDRRSPEMDPVKIALGVAAGILIAGFIAFLARIWFVNQAFSQLNEAVKSINHQTNQQIERERQRAANAQAVARQQDAERRATEAGRQQARETATREAMARQTAKEEAWKRYYQRPETCDQAEGQAFVDCANQHIRTKRRFEELWAAGKL